MGNGASASDVITGGEGKIGTKWNWEYEHGSFEVEFMASGVFFCEKVRARARSSSAPRDLYTCSTPPSRGLAPRSSI